MNDWYANASCPLALIAALSMMPVGIAADRSAAQGDWDEAAWHQEVLEARTARAEHLATSRMSMLAAVDHVWHTSNKPLYFDAAPTGFSYSETQRPDTKVVLTLVGEHWEWRPLDDTASATFRGRPAEPGRLEPGMVLDILGRYTFMIFSGLAGNLQLGVFDDERPAQMNFKGLVHYPPDARYRLETGFRRFDELETIKMLTNITGTRDFFKYGEIRFTIDGQPQRLTAYKEELDGDKLFIPFRDQTAGRTTYGAGRYVIAAEPEADMLILDFNGAVNLPCAYAPRFHCPVPPAENWMQVAVAAGEQTYPLAD